VNDRTPLPEVVAFEAALDKATEDFNTAYERLDDMYPRRFEHWHEEFTPQSEAFSCQISEYRLRRRKAREAAWDALKDSPDPLVVWIVTNVPLLDFSDEVRTVLSILPATYDELEELARTYNWCSHWNRLRDEAVAAGVLPDAPVLSPAHKDLLAWADEHMVALYLMPQFKEKVKALIAETRELALKDQQSADA
jgi:hypothetical protein